MEYLVRGTGGPGFTSRDELQSILRDIVIPSFQMLVQYEKDGVIPGGGLPVGDRAVAFFIKVRSNEELDRLLRRLPIWGGMNWEVTALQSFQGRLEMEQDIMNHR